jgi:GxxExxY protein
VIVELKAVDVLRSVHRAQVLSYLRATGLELGLLINFNVRVLKDGVRRLIQSHACEL